MENLDDLLEQKIELLQSGHSAEEIIKELPAEASDLIPLIRLASDARAVTRPVLKTQIQQEQRNRILRGFNHFFSNRPVRKFGFQFGKHPVKLLPTIGAAALAVIAFTVFGLFYATSASANFATLSESSGLVEVSQDPSSSVWNKLYPGDKIGQGQAIRTSENGAAIIKFRDGSRSELSGSSEIRLISIGRTLWNSIQVELYQERGVTTYTIVPIRNQDGYFRVETPYGTASVHGTVFQVDVGGNSRFSVTQGKVSVNSNQKEVLLTNGQATIVQANASPQEPAYQFTFREELTSTGNRWTAGGVSFQVPAGILNDENFHTGENIKVVGRIENGVYIADRITHDNNSANNAQKDSQMTGVIEAISSDQWIISGQSILIERSTSLPDNAKVGDPVSIHFRTNVDDLKQAISITLLSQTTTDNGKAPHSKRSTSESTITPLSGIGNSDQTTTPPVPTEIASPTTLDEETNHKGVCEDGRTIPPGVDEIATKYQRSADEVNVWYCQGFEIGEIQKAYALSSSSGTSVSDLLAMRTSGMGWGQIEQSLDPRSSQNSSKPNDKKTKTP